MQGASERLGIDDELEEFLSVDADDRDADPVLHLEGVVALLAQEVVQDAFLALWRAPEAYDPSRGPFRTFFLSLVHHRAVDTVRREERLRKRTERALNPEDIYGEDVAEGVVEEAYLGQRRLEVRAALSTLPADQRKVLEMAYFGGATQAQISTELGIPIGTVKTRTLAAIRKLRRALYRED